MADVAVRGIPEQVHSALKRAAARNHRSLNGEILTRLEASLRPSTVDVQALLARIHDRAARMGLQDVDEELIRELKSAGRP